MDSGPSTLVPAAPTAEAVSVQLDRNGLEVLTEDQCLELLASGTLGRVAISSGALPVILPVNYLLVDRTILFRTSPGTKLDAATRGTVVAFEVDEFEPFTHTGWSVNAIGVARDLSTVIDHMTFDATVIPRWVPNGEERVVAISAEVLTGRRVRHDLAAQAS